MALFASHEYPRSHAYVRTLASLNKNLPTLSQLKALCRLTLIGAIVIPTCVFSVAVCKAQCTQPDAPVNVQNSTFATGTGISSSPGVSCKGAADNPSGLADPTDTYNSACPVRNAATYAAQCSKTGATSPLYFPTGHYKFNVSGNSGVIVFNGTAVGITGDGPSASVLENDSPYAALITYVNVYGPSVSGVSLMGNGPVTFGDLLEIVSSQAGSYEHIALGNSAGIGINLQGGSERGRFSDINAGGSVYLLTARETLTKTTSQVSTSLSMAKAATPVTLITFGITIVAQTLGQG